MGVIDYDLKKIKAIAFDVDGVLSPIVIPINEVGNPVRCANVRDGYAMHTAAVKYNFPLAIISGGDNEAVRGRYVGIGLKNEDIYLASSTKMNDYIDFRDRHGLKDEEVAYVGDDIPDIRVMQVCGLPCCPADACPEVREIARYISPCKGGYGVGRDIVEQVMKAHGLWMSDEKAFGW